MNETMGDLEGRCHRVFLSTGSAYKTEEGNVDELVAFHPSSPRLHGTCSQPGFMCQGVDSEDAFPQSRSVDFGFNSL